MSIEPNVNETLLKKRDVIIPSSDREGKFIP